MQFLVQVRPADAPVGATPCEPFKWLKVQYSDPRVTEDRSLPDTSVEAFVRNLVIRRDDQCSHCNQNHGEHVIILLHHDEKVEISSSPIEDPEDDEEQISTWNSCSICQAQTAPNRLTSIAGSFSFAKFVELILYDPNLIPTPELCEHASTERSALVRCFALGSTSVRLKRSTIS
jgi:1-phosphatidylinositol-3-phosphate 5-kinase